MDEQNHRKSTKPNLTRRSFLKMLGMSLVSHFVFLNLSPRKGWATPDSRETCNEPTTTDTCGGSDGSGGQNADVCETSGSTGNIDLCGQSGVNNAISDVCNQGGSGDPDRCGDDDYGNGVVADVCSESGSSPDPDYCGGLDGNENQITDTCNTQAANPDYCSEQGARLVTISDGCENTSSVTDPDKCGEETAEGVMSDSCDESMGNEDKCGQTDDEGGQISDTCDPPDDPDVCDPQIDEPDECHPPEDTDKCRAPGSMGRAGGAGPFVEAEACERGGPIVTDGESDYEF
ncbi:hypothetical protein ACFL96_09615 [Thermoproteota archaeon]